MGVGEQREREGGCHVESLLSTEPVLQLNPRTRDHDLSRNQELDAEHT